MQHHYKRQVPPHPCLGSASLRPPPPIPSLSASAVHLSTTIINIHQSTSTIKPHASIIWHTRAAACIYLSGRTKDAPHTDPLNMRRWSQATPPSLLLVCQGLLNHSNNMLYLLQFRPHYVIFHSAAMAPDSRPIVSSWLCNLFFAQHDMNHSGTPVCRSKLYAKLPQPCQPWLQP